MIAALLRAWLAIPAQLREPFKSWFVSGLLGLQPTAAGAIVGGAAAGAVNLSDFGSCVHYLTLTWWGIFLGAFFAIGPFYRAKQGSEAVKTATAARESTRVGSEEPAAPSGP